MARRGAPSFRLPLRIPTTAFLELSRRTPGPDGKVEVGSVVISEGEYVRPCPGRGGQPCCGTGEQVLELRNMGEGIDVQVRDQPCCRACRSRKKS
jgi:hypothetical protein